MRIYLTGFMGSGKSFFGKKIARAYAMAYVDLDHAIEMHFGKFIPQIFEQHGEAAFRQMEQEILHRTALLPNAVIACGGGTPCFFDNMEWMNTHGLTVYLRTSVPTLVKRLESDPAHQRPLLKNLSGQALEQFIHERLQQREPFYKQAFLSFDTESDNIVEKLKEWLK